MNNAHTFPTWVTFAICSVGAVRAVLRARRNPLVAAIYFLGLLGWVLYAATAGRAVAPRFDVPMSWLGVVASALLVLSMFRVKVRELVSRQGGRP